MIPIGENTAQARIVDMHRLDPVLRAASWDLQDAYNIEHARCMLVASSRLRRARVGKEQVTDESSNSNSKHDPAIICHEQQPTAISSGITHLKALGPLT